jgi:DNA-binding transcriptional regulator YhcF (GntR family)
MQKSLFVETFGDYPMIRVLDFLIENEIFDYSKKDIARYSGVSWNTLERFFNQLIKKGLIVKTRKVGKSQMYKINLENPIVKKIMEIDSKLMLESIKSVEVPSETLKVSIKH